MSSTQLPQLPFFTVNAFAPTPHEGNQAAVVIFPDASDPRTSLDEYMRLVARDFNYAETAFLVPLRIGQGVDVPQYGLRWFTPEVEVSLCGHATLASALVVFTLFPAVDTIEFETRFSGTLTATREQAGIAISLPMPTIDPTPRVGKAAIPVNESTMVDLITFGFGNVPSVLVELSSEVPLKDMKVDIAALKAGVPGLTILTQQIPSESKETLRINSRVFAPNVGIDEDNVTGVAHATLTRYYLDSPATSRLPSHLISSTSNSCEIDALQVSPRGGGMKCAKVGERAKLTGLAWVTGRGTLTSFDLKYYIK